MKITPLEADPCIFMPTSGDCLFCSPPSPPPPLTQLQINQVPWSNMGVAEDIKQSLTWGIDSQNSLLWWNGVVIDKLQLYKSFQNLN